MKSLKKILLEIHTEILGQMSGGITEELAKESLQNI